MTDPPADMLAERDDSPEDHEPTLASAIRDAETIPVRQLSREEMNSELARLRPFREAIQTARKARDAKIAEIEQTAGRMQRELDSCVSALRAAELAFQPSHIAGRLQEIESIVGTA